KCDWSSDVCSSDLIDLLPRLSLCFLAEDRAAAQRLATAYPHLYFLLPDGVCYHGHTVTGGKKSGAGPLAMKREARELAVRLQARERQLGEKASHLEEALENERQELEKLDTQTTAIGEEHAATRAELAGLEERQRGERSAMARLEHEFRDAAGRRTALAPEIERLGELRSRLLAD